AGDRFQRQLQRRLDYQVRDRRNTQPFSVSPIRRLGIMRSRTGAGETIPLSVKSFTHSSGDSLYQLPLSPSVSFLRGLPRASARLAAGVKPESLADRAKS